jgi:8-oxo-dGTP pyrophosphatase MutT (NUDIX family)
MKNLSVVFLIFKEGEKTFVLLGKQAEGKKMPGIRNGFGGKCELVINENREETTLECAKRELKEEANIDVKLKDFVKIGNLINGDKFVDFFVVSTEEKIEIADNKEFVDLAWFDLEKPELFLPDMLSGDHMIIEELQKYVLNPNGYVEFKINKTGDKTLDMQTKNIFS